MAAKDADPNVRTATVEAATEVSDEIFEVEIPEGLDLGGESEPEAPAPAKKPAEEAVADDEPAPKPKVKAKKDEERLPASTREERAKRKHYAELWEKTVEEKDRLEAELRRRQQPQPTAKASKEYREALIKRGNEADTMGALVEIFLDEQDKRDSMWSEALNEERFNRHIQVSEAMARNRWGERYDIVCEKAGIFEAVKMKPGTTQFQDPVLAMKIYDSRDPSAVAYRLAVAKLVHEGKLDEVLGEDASAALADIAEQPRRKRSAVLEEEEAEAQPDKPAKAADQRRAGAREVIDVVGANSSKPRGLGALKPAGPPKKGLTRADLDRMDDENPEALEALFKANPRLRTWWLGGIDTPN
jgi:hypothetical protein